MKAMSKYAVLAMVSGVVFASQAFAAQEQKAAQTAENAAIQACKDEAKQKNITDKNAMQKFMQECKAKASQTGGASSGAAAGGQAE